MQGAAVFDPTGMYRYNLRRTWNGGPRVCFTMLNPSTADATINDRTIRRCIEFAKKWGCGGLVVVNLFAYRATDPKELGIPKDPIGPDNDAYIVDAIKNSSMVVAAWGNGGAFQDRAKKVLPMTDRWLCLGTTKAGHPKHPLYLSSETKLVRL